VTAHERAVRWLTEHVESGDAAYRQEVALTTRELCREAGRSRRCLELLSLLAFALRLRSRARTGDRPDAVWRQGVYVGAVVLLISLATETAAAAWVDAGRLALAAILAGSAVSALRGRRLAAIGLATGAAVVEVAWVSHGVQAGAFVSACAVAIGGLLAGGHELAARRYSGMTLAVGVIMLAGLLAALVIGASAAEAGSVLVFAWIAPVVLLVAGWFDPRLAAAATTIVFARLAASGFGELGRALAVLQQHGQRELLLRWLAMGSSVVAAWLVTHRSIRHVARL
jgi:hypothetical protein